MAQSLSPKLVEELLLKKVKYVLVDIDGVLWTGSHPIAGSIDTIKWLKESLGCQVRFMSNNGTVSREQMKDIFVKRGLTSTTLNEVCTSAQVAGIYLRNVVSSKYYNKNVFVLGNVGLHEEIRKVLAPGCFTYGLELCPNVISDSEVSLNPNRLLCGNVYDSNRIAQCVENPLLPPPLFAEKLPEEVPTLPVKVNEGVTLEQLNIGAVVIALDCSITLTKLAVAVYLLQRHSGVRADGVPNYLCRFVACNEDPNFPVGDKSPPVLLPGAGTITSFLKTALEPRLPDVVCGKPSTMMFEALVDEERESGYQLEAEECLMVGDRVTTDIDFGRRCGMHTLFVLSGVECVADIERTGIVPTYVGDSIADLMKMHPSFTQSTATS